MLGEPSMTVEPLFVHAPGVGVGRNTVRTSRRRAGVHFDDLEVGHRRGREITAAVKVKDRDFGKTDDLNWFHGAMVSPRWER